MGDDRKKIIAKVVATELDVSNATRDIRGLESLVKQAVETNWSENLVNQMKVWLTPYPHAYDISDWDKVILDRYVPLYTVTQKECQDCFQGPCNLEKGKGICGINLEVFQAKLSLKSASQGLATHISTLCLEKFLSNLGKRL